MEDFCNEISILRYLFINLHNWRRCPALLCPFEFLWLYFFCFLPAAFGTRMVMISTCTLPLCALLNVICAPWKIAAYDILWDSWNFQKIWVLTSVVPLFQEWLNLFYNPFYYLFEFELFDLSVLLNANPISHDTGEQISTVGLILPRSDRTYPLNDD